MQKYKKKIIFFYLKIFIFLVLKFSVYLNRKCFCCNVSVIVALPGKLLNYLLLSLPRKFYVPAPPRPFILNSMKLAATSENVHVPSDMCVLRRFNQAAKFLNADNEVSYQTARMRRLI